MDQINHRFSHSAQRSLLALKLQKPHLRPHWSVFEPHLVRPGVEELPLKDVYATHIWLMELLERGIKKGTFTDDQTFTAGQLIALSQQEEHKFNLAESGTLLNLAVGKKLKSLEGLDTLTNQQEIDRILIAADHQNLGKIPDRIFEPFANLTRLSISHAAIDALGKLTLSGLRKLTNLSFTQTKIGTLDLDAFRETPNITGIGFLHPSDLSETVITTSDSSIGYDMVHRGDPIHAKQYAILSTIQTITQKEIEFMAVDKTGQFYILHKDDDAEFEEVI